jgi:tetratricopeptide (TPR) repeat protein
MATLILPANEAITNARAALARKDKLSARHWAQQALTINPHLEDGWLILAAVANPRASLAYLKRALEINPTSERARQGMDWARRRLQAEKQKNDPAPVVMADAQARNTIGRGHVANRHSYLLLLACVLIFITAGWVFWPGAPVMRNTLAAPAPLWPALGIVKPTYTSTPTNTPTPTATFTPTPTATETLTPTSTFTSTNTPTDTPTETPTETPSPTATPFQPAPPTPIPSYHEKKIFVSISQQHLWAYEGDTLVYSFIASTGMNNATRTGTFAVQSKIPNAYGATWNIWMPHWLGIYWAGSLENGIHALPILPNGATLWGGYLGRPISYGCVVLGSYEAALLYDWAEIGTPVIIQW